MSRIYFHTPSGTAEVRGWERASFGVKCNDLAWALFGSLWSREEKQAAAEIFGRRDSDYSDPRWEHFFQTSQHSSDLWFTASLNTALLIGSDPLKLAARIHGQCEIHCWAEGKNRAWLADIIAEGRRIGLYRDESGWEETMALLRQRDDEPVVLSYSVCEQFPSPVDGVDRPEGADDDWWYELSSERQWELAFPALKASGRGLELTPDRWATFYFTDARDAFKLRRAVNERAAELAPKSTVAS